MKVVHSSVNLVSYPQQKYLLAVVFLVVIAFGSGEVRRPSRAEGSNFIYEELIKMKRELDALRTAVRATELMHAEQREGLNALKGGAVYTRWGRTVCPSGSSALYNGVAGGSFWSERGGGSNYLCLSLQPIYGAYNAGVEKFAKLHGSEYQHPTVLGLNNNNQLPLHDHTVPCVICRSQTKTSVVMVPGRNQCYSGWNTEYTGYLMTEKYDHYGRTEFICMDGQPESAPNGYRNEEGALFYNVEGVCGALPCPPYIARREITCAVCTK